MTVARKLPLRKLGRSALDLRHFWIERLEYREIEDVPTEIEEPTLQISRPVVHGDDTGAEYAVTLRIQLSQGDVREIDLTICGAFRLQSDDEGNKGTRELLVYNGSAMLFGSARGIIEAVTSMTGFGRLHVPSANIATLFGTRRVGRPPGVR